MAKQYPPNDAVHFFMSELTSRVIAQSGNPNDRFHMGKIILQSLKDAPDFVSQIDGADDEIETNQSVLERSVRCARAYSNIGLEEGDILVFMAPNHLDLCIPMYAALYKGLIVAPVDRALTIDELQRLYAIIKPKLIFCHNDKSSEIQLALTKLQQNATIVTFDESDNYTKFSNFIDIEDKNIADFRPTDINPEDAVAFLTTTSGTTGFPKAAAVTHKNVTLAITYLWSRFTEFPTPFRLSLVGSPIQWTTAVINYVASPIMRFTRLQSSLPLTKEHAYYLLNTYKPEFAILSPTFITTLINPADRNQCDFSCLKVLYLGGSPVTSNLIGEIQEITPTTKVSSVFGMTEIFGLGLLPSDIPGSSGKPIGNFFYRLVDVDTQEDIEEPNKVGELWLKGPTVFKGYYCNPTATEEAFAEDRWFKTGDLFYRDEQSNYFFKERLKLLLKYKSHQISPAELELVIRQHPGVLDVAVTGIPDPECGDLVVACVIRNAGHDVTAQQIKDLVKDSLVDSKQLRGGVIFVDKLPLTASTKVHRRNLKEMVLHMKRE